MDVILVYITCRSTLTYSFATHINVSADSEALMQMLTSDTIGAMPLG